MMKYKIFSGLLVIFFSLIACKSNMSQSNSGISILPAFPNLRFTRPLDLQTAPDGSDRLFVVEQQGKIFVFENSPDVTRKELFLDITDRVNDRGNEEGLLGLAFHPDFSSNGYFYVDYTADNPRRTVIARYRVDPDNPESALKESEKIIMEVQQPYSNHNGGQIVFGPDGYLYIALGDGGSGGDPHNNGQDRSTLLGSILRIDVNQEPGGLAYGIPPDNPFAGNSEGWKEEIFAYGLRNPWRFSFDSLTGRLWAGDVGQNQYEEIDIIIKGGNYGWNILEGFHVYSSPGDTAGRSFINPVWEYSHSVGQSVTGGFVYRGPLVPELTGLYIYADYVSGRIWRLRYGGKNDISNELLLDTELFISSFGTDQNKELYLCSFDGLIYKFQAEKREE